MPTRARLLAAARSRRSCSLAVLLAALAAATLATASAAAVPDLDLHVPLGMEEDVSAAQKRLASESSLNQCFKSAYDALVVGGCKALDESSKRRFAVYLANCHLEATGRDTYPCPPGKNLTQCGKEMDAIAYSEFSAYTRHVDMLCYTMESTRWREHTGALITSLMSGAEELRDQNRLALEEMKSGLLMSAQLMGHVTSMQSGLEQYSVAVQGTIADTQSSYSALAEVVRQLSTYTQAVLAIQGVVARNFMYVQTAGFYTACGALVWVLTANTRTSGARFWLYGALVATAALEVLVISRWSYITVVTGNFSVPDLPALHNSARFAALGGGGSDDPFAPAGANVTLSGSGSSGFVGALRERSLVLLLRLLAWLGAVVPSAAAIEPAIRRVFDPLSLEAWWDQGAVQWGIRQVYVALALWVWVWHGLAWRDYNRLNFSLLVELQKMASAAAEAERGYKERAGTQGLGRGTPGAAFKAPTGSRRRAGSGDGGGSGERGGQGGLHTAGAFAGSDYPQSAADAVPGGSGSPLLLLSDAPTQARLRALSVVPSHPLVGSSGAAAAGAAPSGGMVSSFLSSLSGGPGWGTPSVSSAANDTSRLAAARATVVPMMMQVISVLPAVAHFLDQQESLGQQESLDVGGVPEDDFDDPLDTDYSPSDEEGGDGEAMEVALSSALGMATAPETRQRPRPSKRRAADALLPSRKRKRDESPVVGAGTGLFDMSEHLHTATSEYSDGSGEEDRELDDDDDEDAGTYAVGPKVPQHEAHTHDLRPRAPLAVAANNPLCGYETPADFALRLLLGWMASAAQRYVEVTAPALRDADTGSGAQSGDDEDAGGFADDWSDSSEGGDGGTDADSEAGQLRSEEDEEKELDGGGSPPAAAASGKRKRAPPAPPAATSRKRKAAATSPPAPSGPSAAGRASTRKSTVVPAPSPAAAAIPVASQAKRPRRSLGAAMHRCT